MGVRSGVTHIQCTSRYLFDRICIIGKLVHHKDLWDMLESASLKAVLQACPTWQEPDSSLLSAAAKLSASAGKPTTMKIMAVALFLLPTRPGQSTAKRVKPNALSIKPLTLLAYAARKENSSIFLDT